jgi:hypothetical protein
MATERLSMRQTREILRQKWSLGRTHREVAQSLGISSGAVGTHGAAGPRGRARLGLGRHPQRRRAAGPRVRAPDPAHASSRRPRLRLPAYRAAQARGHARAAPSRISRAASGRLPLHPVLRVLPPLAPAPGPLDAPGSPRRREVLRRLRRPEAEDHRPGHRRGDRGRTLRRRAGGLELHLRGSDAHPAGPGLDREPPTRLPVLGGRHRGHRARSTQERRRRAVPLRARRAADLRRFRPALRHRDPAGAAGETTGAARDRGHLVARGSAPLAIHRRGDQQPEGRRDRPPDGHPRQNPGGETLPPRRRRTVERPGSRLDPGRREDPHRGLPANTCRRAASQTRPPTSPPGYP